MKSIENFTVLNSWALLVDFLNEHWFIVTAIYTTLANIFLIALKQDCIDAQYVKLPHSTWPFSIFMFYCANEGKMFKNLIILKESTLLEVMQIKTFMAFC